MDRTLTRSLLAALLSLILLLAQDGAGSARAAEQDCPDAPGEECSALNQPGLLAQAAWPDLETLPPFDLRLVRRGSERILRFSNAVWNRGEGALEMRGVQDPSLGSVRVSQVLYLPGESTLSQEMGMLEFHAEHNHWHWDGFSRYEIWSTDAEGHAQELVGSSGKVSYCMMDIRPANPETMSTRRQYGQCGWRIQGISSGWVDVYLSHLPGQDMDITGLPNGLYILRSTANPEGSLIEAQADNNAASVYFSLRDRQVRVVDEAEVMERPDFRRGYR